MIIYEYHYFIMSFNYKNFKNILGHSPKKSIFTFEEKKKKINEEI
jgi:hypothetical protein